MRSSAELISFPGKELPRKKATETSVFLRSPVTTTTTTGYFEENNMKESQPVLTTTSLNASSSLLPSSQCSSTSTFSSNGPIGTVNTSGQTLLSPASSNLNVSTNNINFNNLSTLLNNHVNNPNAALHKSASSSFFSQPDYSICDRKSPASAGVVGESDGDVKRQSSPAGTMPVSYLPHPNKITDNGLQLSTLLSQNAAGGKRTHDSGLKLKIKNPRKSNGRVPHEGGPSVAVVAKQLVNDVVPASKMAAKVTNIINGVTNGIVTASAAANHDDTGEKAKKTRKRPHEKKEKTARKARGKAAHAQNGDEPNSEPATKKSKVRSRK